MPQTTRPPDRDRERSIAELSDAELVQGIRLKSERHFNELYERYFQRIFNFTRVRVHNQADAEEITQETFTAVFRSIDAFRGDSALLTWIFGIARNSINNHLRRLRVQEERLDAAAREMPRPAPSVELCKPDEQLVIREQVESIREELESISRWQVEVFRMRHMEDLPICEIARRTERSEDAVRSSLYRVKRALVEAVKATGASRQAAWSAL